MLLFCDMTLDSYTALLWHDTRQLCCSYVIFHLTVIPLFCDMTLIVILLFCDRLLDSYAAFLWHASSHLCCSSVRCHFAVIPLSFMTCHLPVVLLLFGLTLSTYTAVLWHYTWQNFLTVLLWHDAWLVILFWTLLVTSSMALCYQSSEWSTVWTSTVTHWLRQLSNHWWGILLPWWSTICFSNVLLLFITAVLHI